MHWHNGPKLVVPQQYNCGGTGMRGCSFSHLKQFEANSQNSFEAESITIVQKIAADFSSPVVFGLIGEYSSIMIPLAHKAFI